MIDPRTSIIAERLKNIRNIVAVSSGKGGVGKSLVASTLAVALADNGYKVGLFDLDFTSPSTHLILGIENAHPREEKGVVPAEVHGIEYMSIIYYSGGSVTPLRGEDVSNALIELLSITRWGELDFLILDMPPGIGDATLDLLRLIKGIQFLIITTSSVLAFETVKNLARLLKSLRISMIGVVENMKMNHSNIVRSETEKLGLKLLGEIPYDATIEKAIGDVGRLRRTVFASKVEEIRARIQ